MASTWLDFWQQENKFDNAMSTNYAYFLAKVKKYVTLSKTQKVLDIGSGPGNLEDAWHDQVGEIHGLDISQRYNEMGRAKHAEHPNVFFHDLSPDDYLNFSPVANQRFDVIIVMSVVQYYRNADEVEQLLRNIAQLAAPGAKALICDIMVGSSIASDIMGIVTRSIRQGELFSMMKLLVELRFSSYHEIRKANGFLVLPELQWLALAKRVGLNAQFIKSPITLQKERKSLLIQF
ncbi:methyltransferase domain-containing protein [Spirosoma sp. BT702]|uniref:Methyltransferase domain-containing protein n=1 Tax=Spirosoma profusum TaxID=2771354 RepID=A0A927AR75_9BACT|nr:methyltransferase domain-containing protein [Spirosoma profusum]MBD2699285.1 methyltransferase domain-containing protein [Spirosoma profusum]